MLHPPNARRERALLYGPGGGGKSSGWLAVAEWIHRTKSPAKMYLGDTDRTWDDMAPYDGHLDSIVTPFNWLDWDSIRDGIRKLESVDATRDDWLVLDMMNRCWDRAQEGYFEGAFGKDFDEFFTVGNLADRTKMIAGEYGANWQAINKMYGRLTTLIMSRWPGHVLACTPGQQMWAANEKANQELIVQYPEFGKIGVRPQGQKDLPHQFRTILFMQQAPSGWKMSTAKERNPQGAREGDEGFRPYVTGADVDDFVRSYLMKIAGWKP